METARFVARFFCGGGAVAAAASSSAARLRLTGVVEAAEGPATVGMPRVFTRFVDGGYAAVVGVASSKASSFCLPILGAAVSPKNFLGFRARLPRPVSSVAVRSSIMSMINSFGMGSGRAVRLAGAGNWTGGLGAAASPKNFFGFLVRWPRPLASIAVRSSTMSMINSLGMESGRVVGETGGAAAGVDFAFEASGDRVAGATTTPSGAPFPASVAPFLISPRPTTNPETCSVAIFIDIDKWECEEVDERGKAETAEARKGCCEMKPRAM